MSNPVWQLARAIVWASSQEEVAEAQARLWAAVAPDVDLYHHAIWQASLEKADYLRWERQHQHQHQPQGVSQVWAY
ncbi:MAG: hypothetical protein M3441_05305 [Chloroflexota bacterium]|nr:hypothetical protein [Chloroflexota bacterium]